MRCYRQDVSRRLPRRYRSAMFTSSYQLGHLRVLPMEHPDRGDLIYPRPKDIAHGWTRDTQATWEIPDGSIF